MNTLVILKVRVRAGAGLLETATELLALAKGCRTPIETDFNDTRLDASPADDSVEQVLQRYSWRQSK